MAEIPGWAWAIVGVFVIAISAYVGGMGFFILVGILFIAWGAFKIAREYILPTEPKKLRPWERDAAEMNGMKGVPNYTGLRSAEEIKKFENTSKQVKPVPCPACKTIVWNSANFCHFCGLRLKHPGQRK